MFMYLTAAKLGVLQRSTKDNDIRKSNIIITQVTNGQEVAFSNEKTKQKERCKMCNMRPIKYEQWKNQVQAML
jgi:hypothetical protein